MLSISLDGVSLSYGATEILTDISFALNDGDKLGIVGINGAGKSSLLSIITGKTEHTAGNVCIANGYKTGILEQNGFFGSDKTVLEEAFSAYPDLQKIESELEILKIRAENDELSAIKYAEREESFRALGGYEYKGRAKGILRHLGLSDEVWDSPVSVLSGGQKTRLALSCLLMSDPDILILDEPTNHLDVKALLWLEGELKKSRKTVIAVSHDRYFLDSVATKILDIDHKKGKIYSGNYSVYAEKKRTERQIEARHYENEQKELRRQEAYIEQQRRWNRERNIIAAESRLKQLEKKEYTEKPESENEKARMSFTSAPPSGNDVFTVTGIKKEFPGKKLFSDVSFLIEKNQRVFFTGENGCGKSTLLKIVAGRLGADAGFVVRGAGVSVGYYDQENREINEENTVIDELWNAYPTMTETEIRSYLALFLFKGEDVFKKISVLSGGEKARITLLKLMLRKVNVLILDEPTNHLDIPSREVLEDAILSFDGTVLCVSHDRYFLKKLYTRIINFTPCADGFKPTDVDGFDEYIALCSEENGQKSEAKAEIVSENKQKWLDMKKDRSEARKLENKIKKSKSRIEEIEKRLSEISGEINGEAGFDAVKLTALEKEQCELENELLELYEFIDGTEGL